MWRRKRWLSTDSFFEGRGSLIAEILNVIQIAKVGMGFRHRWPKRDNALVSLGRHLIVPSRLSLASFRIQLDQNIILRNGRRRVCDQREQGSSVLLHSLSPLTHADRLMLFPWT